MIQWAQFSSANELAWLNGSGQQSHTSDIKFRIFKYVRIHPNFTSRPESWAKVFTGCFSLQAGRKDLTHSLTKVLSAPHPSLLPPELLSPETVLDLDAQHNYDHPVLNGEKLLSVH